MKKKIEIEMKGDPRFHQLLEVMRDIHNRKSMDYSEESDPLSNFKLAEKIGVPPWKGVLIRMSDKFSRLCRLADKGKAEVKDETFADTLIDLAVYALICRILYEDKKI